jgi:ribosomal protein L13
LYAAPACLNSHLFYDELINMDKEVKEGLENIIRKLLPSKEVQNAVMKELKAYHSLDSSIFSPMTINSFHIYHPRKLFSFS